MRRTTIILLSAFLLACDAGDGERIAKAWAAYDSGNPAEARALAEEAARSPPGDAFELARLAGLFVELQDPRRAVALVGARVDEPDAAAALVDAMANAHLVLGERERARYLLLSLTRRGVATADTHRLLGTLALGRKDLAGARTELETARRMRADDPPAEALYGWLLFSEGKAAEAFAHLRAVCRRHPGAVEPAVMLAQVLVTASADDPAALREAVALLEPVAKRRPLDRGSRQNLGLALNRLGRFLEAELLFDALAAEEPDRAEWWTSLGVARMGRKKVEEAVEAFRRAEGLAPEDLGTLLNLGNAYLELALVRHEREEPARQAAEVFERARRLAPRQPDVYVGLARACLKADPASDERAEKAMAYYRQALALDPGDFEANLNIALLYYDLWNFDRKAEGEGFTRAKEHFEKAAARVPPERWEAAARGAFEEIRKR